MDDEMIERCVKAAYKCLDDETIYVGELRASNCVTLDGDFNLSNLVVTIVKAMREPTNNMLMIDAPDMPAGGDVADIWRDMIDVIIKEIK